MYMYVHHWDWEFPIQKIEDNSNIDMPYFFLVGLRLKGLLRKKEMGIKKER